MTTSSDEAREVANLVKRIKPLLAGYPPGVQGGTLAVLLSIWLAGHHIAGDRAATKQIRAEVLAMHLLSVAEMLTVNAKIIGTTA